jgi:hypothetical protein
VTASFAGNTLADLLTESRIMSGNLVRVARWAAGLLLLLMIGTGAGVLLLILVPIVWMRALLGFDPLLKEEDMAWLE